MDNLENLKITIVGEDNVGKTNIISKFVKDNFIQEHIETIGARYTQRNITLCEFNNKEIKLDLWDTAGNKKYRSLIKCFFDKAFAIVLVFDITNRESFEKVKNEWEQYIQEKKPIESGKY